MGEITREELQRLYTTLDQGFAGVHSRLDTMNGRVSTNSTAIAVLNEKVKGMEDASSQAKVWAGGIAGVGVALVEGVKWVMGK